MRKLHALLVGINTYAHPAARPLNGCLHDVEQFGAYLTTLSDHFDLTLKALRNEQATKANVAGFFTQYVPAAGVGPGDVVLFYFSGHGVRELAPAPLARFEETRALECLLCYDSYAPGRGVSGLANKELRFLIRQAAESGADVVVITDCCHSGKATRGGLDPRERLLDREPLAARPWSQFLFADVLPAEVAAAAPSLQAILPAGRHIHLAASGPDESAFEVGGAGIFTSHLVEVLQQSSGAVRYGDLQSRTANLIAARARQYAQRPRFHSYRPDAVGTPFEHDYFLGLAAAPGRVYANLVFGEQGAYLDRGAIHGLPVDVTNADGTPAVTFAVLTDNPSAEPISRGAVTNVLLGRSQVALFESIEHPLASYRARLEGLYARNFNVALVGNARLQTDLRTAYAALRAEDRAFTLVDAVANADFLIYVEPENYLIVHPDADLSNADTIVPLVEQVARYKPGPEAALFAQLQHLAHWHLVRNVKKSSPLLHEQTIRWSLHTGTDTEPRTELQRHADGHYYVPVEPPTTAGGNYHTHLWAMVRNNTDRVVHVELLYLSSLFGVYTGMLGANAIEIEPRRSNTGYGQRFCLQPYVIDWKLPYETGLFRLYVATETFDVTMMQQSELPPPKRLTRGGIRGDESAKGPGFQEADVPPALPDWTVLDFPVRIVNPVQKGAAPGVI